MLKATGSYCTYSSLIKLQPWFLILRWKTCLRQNCNLCSLSLQWKTCFWAEIQSWFLTVYSGRPVFWQNYNLVPEFAVKALPLGRTATLVPEFAAKDLPLGRTLRVSSILFLMKDKCMTGELVHSWFFFYWHFVRVEDFPKLMIESVKMSKAHIKF